MLAIGSGESEGGNSAFSSSWIKSRAMQTPSLGSAMLLLVSIELRYIALSILLLDSAIAIIARATFSRSSAALALALAAAVAQDNCHAGSQGSVSPEEDTASRFSKLFLWICYVMLGFSCMVLLRFPMERQDCFDLAMPEAKAPHRYSLPLESVRYLPMQYNMCASLATSSSTFEHGIEQENAKTSSAWVAATAAPHHATGNRSLFTGSIIEHIAEFVHAADGVPRKVLARGAVITDTVVLPDVWFVPGLTENLVSVKQLVELDHSIGFGRGECCITSAPDGKVVGKGHLQKGGNYVLDFLNVCS